MTEGYYDSLNETFEKQPERIPFRIRGHHIWEFGSLVEADPDKKARESANLYEILRDLYTNDPIHLALVTDAIGETDLQLRQFEESMGRLFKRFKELPDDYPVELVEGSKDEICRSCIAGKGLHCSVRFDYTGENPDDAISYDRRHVNFFISKTYELGLANTFSTRFEMTEFSDSPPASIRVVTTTIKTFNTITNGRQLIIF